MSDKKQPAQQRVNVRIVKADDPEQRGGMKPIAKADGSLQISPEEACTAGIWTKPPFDLRGLSKMVDESTILPQCIRAYKSNIAGFGIDIRYKDDFADADETPEMKAEWDRATEVVEMLNMEQESNELFEDIVEARETYGCAYAEVIRDISSSQSSLWILPRSCSSPSRPAKAAGGKLCSTTKTLLASVRAMRSSTASRSWTA